MGTSRSRLGRVAAVAVAVALSVGAADEAGPKAIKAPGDHRPLKIAVLASNASDYFELVLAGTRRYEREEHAVPVTVTFKIPASGKADDQIEMLKGLDGYDGVAVAPVDPAREAATLDELAKTTNVVCYDSDVPAAKRRLLFVGTDNERAGKTAGEQVVKLLPDGGKIGVFVGRFDAKNAADRLAGLEKAVDGHHIEIVARGEDQADRQKAQRLVADALSDHPEMTLAVGLWSYNGPAIAKAVTAADKKGKVLVVCFDQEAQTLAGVRDGTISCTVCQRPDEAGYQAVRWLHDLAIDGDAAKRPADGTVDPGLDVVDAKTVDAFEEKLAAMKAAADGGAR